jgi:hypothetical protein
MGLLDVPGVLRPRVALNPGQLFGTDTAGANAALNHQLDYACDLSGVATVIPTTGLPGYVNGLGVIAPVTARNAVLRWGGFAQITAAGAGSIALTVYETTSGAAVVFASVSLAGTFIVAGLMSRDAASTLTASIRSSATGAVRAWIKVVAE